MPIPESQKTHLENSWSDFRRLLRTGDELEIRGSSVAQELLNEVDPIDPLRRTPVMLGYWWGNLAAANELVKMGADYAAVDDEGHAVSWYARNFGRGANAEGLERRISAEKVRISMNSAIREVLGSTQVQGQALDGSVKEGKSRL